jgi:hypothetical protein
MANISQLFDRKRAFVQAGARRNLPVPYAAARTGGRKLSAW